MKIKAVDFASYVVTDLKRSIDFYQNILGLKLTSSGEAWAEFDVGNVALVIGTYGNAKPGGGSGVAFAVDDVQATLDELKSKGVKIEGDGKAWESPVCFGGNAFDPDGNAIYFHKRKDGTVG